MSHHQTLATKLLAAFQLDADADNPAAVADVAAALLIEIAEVLRGPAPVVAELGATESHVDETPALILAELRKQNTLLEVIAKQGEQRANDLSSHKLGCEIRALTNVIHSVRSYYGAVTRTDASGLSG